MADILFTADKILTPVLTKFYELRPNAQKHINLRSGVYWHPFLGYRGQAARAIVQLVDLVKNGRLSTAEGEALLDLVESEFDTLIDTTPTFARGEMSLTRSSTIVAGDVPKGTRFSRPANLTTQIPVAAATYETLANAHFNVGQATVTGIPIQALTAGAAANHPIRTDVVAHGVAGSGLFDPSLTVSAFSTAGGSDKPGDNYVRQFARAYSLGQYGPTADASRYGALLSTGVRYMLAFDLPGTGTQKILIADQSWGSSSRWAAQVQQSIYDADLIGHGCKVVVDQVRNKVITVEATVALRDRQYRTETLDVDEAIRKAARSYFDDRPDWNVWNTTSLKGAITRAHAKILNCSAATVKDVTGATLTQITTPDYNSEQFHYYLANSAVVITYQDPT